MTSEEKREQLLKRVLPGLAITVIYFVFISGMMAEKMKKAETDYKAIISNGASKDALTGVINQQNQTQQNLTGAQKKVTELQGQFNKMAGFLSNNGSSANIAMGLITAILDDCQVKIRKDEKSILPEDKLALALKEVWQGIKPPEADDKKTTEAAKNRQLEPVISAHHLWLKGSYPNMYQALKAIAEPKLQALPISLTMHMPETDDNNSAELEWELILWM